MNTLADLVETRPHPHPFAEAPSTTVSGLWECDLATERLIWSDGVYDLFGLPRGAPLDRAATAARYRPASRIAMEYHRFAAIRDKTGFTCDAEIEAGAQTRWIRIVAQVETAAGKAVRLFGSKSDVTHEYAAWAAAGRTVSTGR